MRIRKVLICAWLMGIPFMLSAQEDSLSLDTYLDMSLEELMNIEITSVSKKAERIQDVPSSIYVITSEDISRSTAPNLMQLLRDNVPGYWAAENDYKNVDALMRSPFEGSVLVLLDGTPMQDLMSSSFDYESFDLPFEHIDRIEVIRGSGGTVYGANSATGVISIYTKHPEDSKKIYADVSYAAPGKSDFSIIATPSKSGKLTTSVYGKYSAFSGFEQLEQTEKEMPTVPKLDGTGDTTIINRFTGDDNSVQSITGGINLAFKATDKLKLTSAINLTNISRNKYVQYFPPSKAELIYTDGSQPKLFAGDSVALEEIIKTRVVANLQGDYSFSENHSLFARVSTNYENADFSSGGGFNANNRVLDFEIQDNLTLGINNFSIGGNYRLLKYDLSEFDEDNQVMYTDNENDASLIGFFVQDKISLLDEKLNVYLGAKAESFNLIDDKFYFSPMAKFTVIPNEDFTFWGGFSQSYTTPGYNQTNVEYFIFRAESPEVFYNYAYPQVSYGVYQQVYQQAIAGGADEATAAATAQAYIESDEGLQVIDAQTNEAIGFNASIYPGHYNVAGTNGPNTVPTSFTNFDAGIRISKFSKLSFEANFYYSIMKDGIGNSLESSALRESEVYEGETIMPYFYGNYFTGRNMGLEMLVKYFPMEKLRLELSHVWHSYTLELQENDDFDVAGYSEEDRNVKDEDYPLIPAHVLRGKIYYDITDDFQVSLSAIYSTSYWITFGTIEPNYQHDNQRFDPLYGDGGEEYILGGKQDSRLIMNLRIDKYFMNQKLNVYLFGNDFLSEAFVEGINQIETVYPRQVGGMLGMGIKYMID